MIAQTLKMAWSAIASSKMRSFLTMLGIIIGVIAIVVLVSLVNGASDTVQGQIEDMGTNLLSVTIKDDKGRPMTLNDVMKVGEDPAIAQVSPLGSMTATAKKNTTTETVQVNGVTAAYGSIQNLKVESGRFIRTADVNNSSSVAVLNPRAADKLFGTQDAVGNTFSISGRNFLVVGVLEDTDDMVAVMMGNNSTIYIPFTVESRMSRQPYINTFYASSTDENSMDEAEAAINKLMMQRFRQDEDAFSVFNQSVLMDTMNTVTNTMTLLLGGIAAISLVVGGIGIMNIMLVSVSERTREIGIRKAIGASRGSILMQFLIESLMLSLIGCAIGLAASWFLLELVSAVAANSGSIMTFSMSLDVVVLAVGFSITIGVVFGIYPANKASILHPIQALRYE